VYTHCPNVLSENFHGSLAFVFIYSKYKSTLAKLIALQGLSDWTVRKWFIVFVKYSPYVKKKKKVSCKNYRC